MHNVHWRGIRLRHILDLAAPLQSAPCASFVSSEHPYEDSLTIEQALLPDVMLALDLDGSPCRGRTGRRSARDPGDVRLQGREVAERIEVVADQPTGFWENLGYDQDAWVGKSNGHG